MKVPTHAQRTAAWVMAHDTWFVFGTDVSRVEKAAKLYNEGATKPNGRRFR